MKRNINLQKDEYLVTMTSADKLRFHQERGKVRIIHNACVNYINSILNARGTDKKFLTQNRALISKASIMEVIAKFIDYDKNKGGTALHTCPEFLLAPLAGTLNWRYSQYLMGRSPIPTTINRKQRRQHMLIAKEEVEVVNATTLKFDGIKVNLQRPKADGPLGTSLSIVCFNGSEKVWIAKFKTEEEVQGETKENLTYVTVGKDDNGDLVATDEQGKKYPLPHHINAKSLELDSVNRESAAFTRRKIKGDTLSPEESKKHEELQVTAGQLKSRVHNGIRYFLESNKLTDSKPRPKKVSKPSGKPHNDTRKGKR